MLRNNIIFKGEELNDSYVFSLGTPDAVNTFIDNRYAFLFDLDGTLVLTDDIYFNVWYEILDKYNITLTFDMFKEVIQGNNDKYVLKLLLVNISLEELSTLKDTLFIQNITKLKIIDGVYDILKKIKLMGHKICIVTNCNRKVAEEIIKYINIDTFIDFIISNNDCKMSKPNSEPYLNALNKYNISNTKCIIFEDSKAGILSGTSINPKLLIGIETIYTSEELFNYGVDLCIKNYEKLEIKNLIDFNNNKLKYMIKLIKNNLKYDIKNIIIDETKLKGGFIADVIGFKIETIDNILSFIIKYENITVNNLSIMAKKLELYKREYYFYEHISNYVNINIPKFIALLKNENLQNCGIILENLLDKKYKINLNLNIENIDISLKIIDRIAKLHCKFWNKDLKNIFSELKKNDDIIFCPFFKNFITKNYNIFKSKWSKNLNLYQLQKCDEIFNDFENIQKRLSNNNLTLIHGDIKSPNIFYDIENNYDPYFLDWQHCAIGKGVQDLIFFIIESFDINNIELIYNLFIPYYYKKLLEYNIINYSFQEYKNDILDALYYIPFFTAIWFGSISNDELIDKNFPYFFINKLFYLIELITKK